MHRQHAVLALGRDAASVNRLVDGEGAIEIAFLILLKQRRLSLGMRLDLAMQEQFALLVAQIDIFGPHAGQLGKQRQLGIRLDNIRSWSEEHAAARRFGAGLRPVLRLRIGDVGHDYFLLLVIPD
jgi:hypothetical protein